MGAKYYPTDRDRKNSTRFLQRQTAVPNFKSAFGTPKFTPPVTTQAQPADPKSPPPAAKS